MAELSPGAPAPDFSLPADGGGEVSLAGLRGKPVVLFFYPKDDTEGCTVENIAFSALIGDFGAAGVAVLGISPDPVRKHDRFKAKHDLKVRLLSDEDHHVLEAYGVWKQKSMYGRTYMGVERTTFLIDKDGKIAEIWPKVKVAGHAEAVLARAKEL
ncbi:thioredoxin-dependent thiol peroxidase [Rhizobium sp. TRM96647]|uniref:thioredoxin-dependent thiol peroxidase n=1 Tax=unclassified Rhizobium TaxID=2613769 RepID=UPI0021E8894D|nr:MULTISPECIES: thioredoxin-dependent thiol peroxidase [unclassified Rhizobium]MCV3737452.1 thioredoxin-dependent thiol peroxidase [Rhizobium sp. TRM96647]MCV3756458.1 thioredoxin-dependent thiol peroxidase [Rhizobium sp. TRM96650]